MYHIGPDIKGEITVHSRRGGRIYKETLPDGSSRLYNKWTMQKGCGKVVENVREGVELIYCPHCERWYNRRQFSERPMEDTEQA